MPIAHVDCAGAYHTRPYVQAMNIALLAFLLTFLASACSRPPPPAATPPPASLDPTRLTGERALAAVAELVALGPRPSGGAEAERAATLIADRLRASGAAVEVDTFPDDTPAGTLTFRNVLGTFAGNPEALIVLLSHYDTKTDIDPAFVGANDSGSSSGLLLALADVLRERPAGGPTILLAFLDGEECRQAYSARDGLHGSRRLAARLVTEDAARHVRAVILLDMVGDRDLTVTLPRNSSPELLVCAFAAAQAEGIRERFRLIPDSILDDHVPFLERGMPAIDLIDFEFGSAPGLNDYWHTTHDTLDKLSAKSLEHMGRVVIRMLNALSAPPPT